MNDRDLDQLLTSYGELWRADHAHASDADVSFARSPRRVFRVWLPLTAAAAVAAVLISVATIGAGSHRTRVTLPTGPSPSPSSSGPVTSIAVPGETVSDVVVAGNRVVDIRAYNGRNNGRDVIEVRDLDDSLRVVATVRSRWTQGGLITCPAMAGTWLFYTDIADPTTNLTPGPPEPWRLVAYDLTSGQKRTLASGMADINDQAACAQTDGAFVAWVSGDVYRTASLDATVLTVSSWTSHRVRVVGDITGIVSRRLVTQSFSSPTLMTIRAFAIQPDLLSSFALPVHDGLAVTGSGDRFVWQEKSRGTNDAVVIRTCVFPCTQITTLKSASDGETVGAGPAVGDQYVVWGVNTGPANAPALHIVHLNGRPVSMNITGRITVSEVATYGDVVVYVSTAYDGSAQALNVIRGSG